ncbi:MAG: HAMP domain-containing sensor histidine kinase [Bacteroidota bacterium]|nr:HAMP domain-containing sensor histidine kinase [Bacteroidota bacterium]
MKVILCAIILSISSALAVFAGEVDYVSNNSLVTTYYTNAKNLLNSKPTECIYWADKAIAESKAEGNGQDLCRNLLIKGQALENLHQYKEALKYIHETRKVAENYKLFDLELEAINKLSRIYAEERNYQAAVLYATLLHDKKDSIAVSHQRALSKMLSGKADLQKREIKMKQLIADNIALDDHLRSNLKIIDSQGNWIFIIVIAYTLVFLLFIIIKRQNKIILKKNQLLTQKMQTLESGKLELDHNLYKAEESERLKTAFLANISHEIRTPLNAIVSFSGFLRQKEKPVSERRKYIEVIHNYSESLLALINEIFEVARIESGEIKQVPEMINVNEFLQKIQTQFYMANKKSSDKEINLILNIQHHDQICYINTYPERLRSVMFHLIENALRYSENTTVELGYIQKESFIEFYVKDDGKGLPPEDTSKTFARFKKVDVFPKPGFGTLGLGLTISKNFIESMGGNIWIKTNNNTGSTFFFTLPIQYDMNE